jgi:iron complex transport system substrate-binding protein
MPAIIERVDVVPAEWTPAEWEALVAALTRRRLIGSGLALGLLTACGTTAPPTPTPTAPVTRMITTAMGSVAVPASPQRIVCFDSYSVATALDLGVTPIAIPDKMGGAVVPAQTATVLTIPTVGAYGQPDLEKLATLKPDLIMAITIDSIKAVYDRLSAIAPTTLFDYTVPDAWRVLAGQFGDAANRAADLKALQARYQERATAIRTTYAGILGKTRWQFIMGRGETWQLYTPLSGGGKVLADAGVQFASAIQGLTVPAKSYSLEEVNLLADADVIVTYGGRDGAPLATHAPLAALPTWQALPAVKNNHVFYMPDIITFSYNSALGLFDQLEAALKQL